ncbi:MAG: hypothetical protein HYZ73_04375 [Elusimicrobia bacterium]|nr:hypothetical protein [Elusimicrobiota bacterium]
MSEAVRIIGCCVALPKNSRIANLKEIHGKRRFEVAVNILEHSQGIANVCYADVPRAICISGKRDGTIDIPRMSRTDNLWSQVFMFTVTATSATLCLCKNAGGYEVALFLDPKSLTPVHWDRIREWTIPKLQSVAESFAGTGVMKFISVQQVEK